MEQQVLAACFRYPEGATNDNLAKELPEMSMVDIAQAINNLLSNHRVQVMLKGPNNEPIYKAVQKEEANKFKALNVEELLVYQCISRAGNVGIWTKDIKRRTNLPQVKINKIVTSLQGRNLIKLVKSVQNSNRKMYMLAELEPAREITGGPWYNPDGKLDASFIDGMQQAALGFLRAKGVCTVADVLDFIEEKKVCQLPLQTEDVSLLLNNLVYSGLVESMEDADGDVVYRLALQPELENTPLAELPCGVCPVIHDCCDGGAISPATCVYYKHWLDF